MTYLHLMERKFRKMLSKGVQRRKTKTLLKLLRPQRLRILEEKPCVKEKTNKNKVLGTSYLQIANMTWCIRNHIQ